MKQILSTITLLGAFAGAASAAPYVLPSPQPGALTSYDLQPVYSIEGLYNIAQDGDLPDTYGVRGSFSLYNSAEGTFRHQLNINVAAAWGSDDTLLTNLLPCYNGIVEPGQMADMDLFVMPVTLGYNLNIALTDNFLLYLGGKAGFAWSHARISASGTANGYKFDDSISDDDGGFTYSVGAGIKVQCSDSVYIHAGYEFGRSYLEFKKEEHSMKTIYGAHTISLGLGAQF